jgi:hypothetical protein
MKLTLIVIIGTVFGLVAYDIYIISAMGKQESISAYMIRLSHEHPSIPFLAGVLCGHFFWRMKRSDIWPKKEKQSKLPD